MSLSRSRWKAAFALLACAVMVAAWFLSPRLLYIETPTAKADVIIVLGGEAEGRVWRAFELYKEGVAPRILVTGAGEGALPRQRLELAGVDPGVIAAEDRSRNTRENAEYSVSWMREQGLHSAVIVTTWWHSRRALACFRKFGPDLEFASMPWHRGKGRKRKASVFDVLYILQEYVKAGWYAVRHGVWVWGSM